MFIFDAVCWQVQARPEKPACQVDLWAHQTVTFYSPLQTYSSSSLIRGLWLWNLCSIAFFFSHGLNLHALWAVPRGEVWLPSSARAARRIISAASPRRSRSAHSRSLADIRQQQCWTAQILHLRQGSRRITSALLLSPIKTQERNIDGWILAIGKDLK